MRLIGSLANEKQAFIFYSFLLQEGVHSTYEPYVNPETKEEEIRIWVYEEDALDRAKEWLEEYRQSPNDPRFAKIPFPFAPPQPPDLIAQTKKAQPEKKWAFKAPKPRKYPLTGFVLLICIFLYFWNSVQQVGIAKREGMLGLEMAMTPLQQQLLFDYPEANQEIDKLLAKNAQPTTEKLESLPEEAQKEIKAAQAIPTWKGLTGILVTKVRTGETPPSAKLFEKIQEGELWRFVTPILMHGGLLHILFNMAWAFLLIKQMETRLKLWKLCFLILLIATVSNIAQYFVSGPYFLGFSGVICGLVGFIWVRQKIAPWEGYPLQRSVIIFVLVFVGAMFALECIALILNLTGITSTVPSIANTAHIIGGLTGMLLARIPLFSRGMA